MFRLFFFLLLGAISSAFGQFALTSSQPENNSLGLDPSGLISFSFNKDVSSLSAYNGFIANSNLRGAIEIQIEVSNNIVSISFVRPLVHGEELTITVLKTLASTTGELLINPTTFFFSCLIKPSIVSPPNFNSRKILNVGATSIMTTDMDGDNDVDLFLSDFSSKWLENNGHGQFTAHDFPLISSPYSIRFFDIDADKDNDIIASIWNGLVIFENLGSQNFIEKMAIAGNSISSFDIIDIDSNGEYDIVYSGRELVNDLYLHGTYVLYGNGTFNFTKAKINSNLYYDIKCLDLDNDKVIDILHHSDSVISYSTYKNNSWKIDTLSSKGVNKMLVGDFDGDHDQDILTTGGESPLQIWKNNGVGGFLRNEINIDFFSQLSTGDYDGDHDIDLILLQGTLYSLYQNDGSGNFTKSIVTNRNSEVYDPKNIASADFDADGDLDFVSIPIPYNLEYHENSLFPFSDVTPIDVKTLFDGDSDWGDFDNDGDLDLITTGGFGDTTLTILYRNQNGKLIEEIQLPGAFLGSCDWGDMDNDGDLDILLMGSLSNVTYDPTPHTSIYINNNGNFIYQETSLPKSWYGESRWADFDDDGALDIITMANGSSGIYRSNGLGEFSKWLDLPSVFSHGNLDMGDFDADGDLDLVVSGWGGSNLVFKVYKNDGGWNFKEVIGDFSMTIGGNVGFEDFDADGDLDLLVSGQKYFAGSDGGFSPSSILLYENLETHFKAVENAELIFFYADINGTTSVGDYDNDGDFDIAASTGGGSSISPELTLLKNTGNLQFGQSNLALPKLISRTASWADLDRDQDLDLFVQSKLLINNVENKNKKPNPPTTMVVDSIYNNAIYFHWDPGHDVETKPEGLSYNLYVGTGSGLQNIVNSNSYLNNGYRKLSQSGPIKGFRTKVEKLRGGTYYYGIQSIDASFEGSAFSSEGEVFMIGIHGNSGVCLGLTNTYVAEPKGNYQWEVFGGEIIFGQGTDSIMVNWTSLGDASIKVSNTHGSNNKLPIKIDEIPKPIISGDLTVCTGLENYAVNDSLSYSAIWSVTGDSTKIKDNQLLSVVVDWADVGNQTLIVQTFPKYKGCFSRDSVQVMIDQRPQPKIVGQPVSCTNHIELYEAQAIRPDWSIENGTVIENSGSTLHVKWPAVEGFSKLILAETSARSYCSSADTLLIRINESPPKPTISLVQDTILLSSPSPTDYYNWYYQNELVLSGPYFGVIPYVEGIFVVETFNSNGCSSKSDPYNFIITDVATESLIQSNFQFYPNPASKSITIEISDNFVGTIYLYFRSTNHTIVQEHKISKLNNLLQVDIDISDLSPGLFQLEVRSGSNKYYGRLMKSP